MQQALLENGYVCRDHSLQIALQDKLVLLPQAIKANCAPASPQP